MKKLILFLIVLLYPIVGFSAIDECKTDIYFANGILTEDWQAEANAELLETVIKDDIYGDLKEIQQTHRQSGLLL